MNWLFAIFLLAGPIVTADGEQVVSGPVHFYDSIWNWINGFKLDTVHKTTGNVTLYVRSTGDDSNDCLSSGNACLTIQSATNETRRSI